MAQELVETNVLMVPEKKRVSRWSLRKHRRRCCDGGERQDDLTCARQCEAPLSLVPAGESVEVTRLVGDEAFRGRIMALGIVPGAVLNVVSGGSGRPLVLAVSGSRLLLDARSSQSILTHDHERRACAKAACYGGGIEECA